MTDDNGPVLNMEEREEIRERMRTLDDGELFRICAVRQSDYRPEALECARAEIRSRGLTVLTAEEEFERRHENKPAMPPSDPMTKSEREEIGKRMRGLDDAEILRICTVEQSDYRPEALESARAEMLRRGLTVLTAEEHQDGPREGGEE